MKRLYAERVSVLPDGRMCYGRTRWRDFRRPENFESAIARVQDEGIASGKDWPAFLALCGAELIFWRKVITSIADLAIVSQGAG